MKPLVAQPSSSPAAAQGAATTATPAVSTAATPTKPPTVTAQSTPGSTAAATTSPTTQDQTSAAPAPPASLVGARVPSGRKPRVVIIGAGFGGRAAAQSLAGRHTDVTVIEKSGGHTFLPSIFQVASGQLAAKRVVTPLDDDLGRLRGVKTVQSEVARIDLDKQELGLADGTTLPYDYLIVAAGTSPGYFGHPEWADVTIPLKSVADAERIKTQVHESFGRAAKETDPEKRAALLTFAMIGGGPSGVELAGSLVGMTQTLHAQYPELAKDKPRIVLVEGGARLLGPFAEASSKRATLALTQAGVEVRTSTRVEKIEAGRIHIGQGQSIAAGTIVWTAGTQGSPVGKLLGVPLDRGGLVPVQADLSIAGRPEVFVIGDLAAAQSKGSRVPPVVQGAVQGGTHAAKSILADLTKGQRQGFEYKNLGSAAYVLPGEAIVELPKGTVSGFVGYLAWLAIHVGKMPKSLFERATILAANLFGSGPGRTRLDAPSVATVNNLDSLPRSRNAPHN